MHIFKCGLHLTTQPMNHEIAQSIVYFSFVVQTLEITQM